jgi:hypothetical protein
MQKLWAKLLAGEVNKPGTISRHAIIIMSSIDKNVAEEFTALCSFTFGQSNRVPFIFDVAAPIYNVNGIAHETLIRLESIGLVKVDTVNGFKVKIPDDSLDPISKWLGPSGELGVGAVILTPAGQELSLAVQKKHIEGFLPYAIEQLMHEVERQRVKSERYIQHDAVLQTLHGTVRTIDDR